MTREEKIAKRIERSRLRNIKNKKRFAEWRKDKELNRTEYCHDCGGYKSWCGCCQMFTQNCCVDYGTCMCS